MTPAFDARLKLYCFFAHGMYRVEWLRGKLGVAPPVSRVLDKRGLSTFTHLCPPVSLWTLKHDREEVPLAVSSGLLTKMAQLNKVQRCVIPRERPPFAERLLKVMP